MQLRYEVKGMSCAACVGHVERAAKSVVGKEDTCSVSLLTNSLLIETKSNLDHEQIAETEKKLRSALRAAGYDLLLEEKTEDARKSERRRELTKLVACAVLSILLMVLAMGRMWGIPIPKEPPVPLQRTAKAS